MVHVHDCNKTSFSAGSDTVRVSRYSWMPLTDSDIQTVSSMYSLFLALVLFPQVQRRAQVELDLAIGRDRLPTFDDRPRLSYIEALCKELMRWQMVTPLGMYFSIRVASIGIKKLSPGLAHTSSRDDVYKGFFIPKGLPIFKYLFCYL